METPETTEELEERLTHLWELIKKLPTKELLRTHSKLLAEVTKRRIKESGIEL